ncbi:MAG: hypothetical protein U0804_07400 [Gemmataceae bacterium]
MVMRNRHDGGAPGWWDDLPPAIKARFAERPLVPAEARSQPSALEWVRELSRVALLFLAVAVANVLFLLVALSFLGHGRPTPP